MPIKVYCAGNIAKNDWRHDIAVDLREVDSIYNGNWVDDAESVALKTKEVLLHMRTPGFLYCGPYFISCDHGCFHENPLIIMEEHVTTHQNRGGHGVGGGSHTAATYGCGDAWGIKPNTPEGRRSAVFAANTARIQQADLIFAHINRPDAYGTLAEIGFAYALKKPILLSFDPFLSTADDMWFAAEMADVAMMAKPARAWNLLSEFVAHCAAYHKDTARLQQEIRMNLCDLYHIERERCFPKAA